MDQYQYLFKIILIGDSNVGKSSLMLRFTTNRFKGNEYEPTIGVEFGSKLINVSNNTNIKLQLWDTAGQESFRSITRSYYRSSIGALLIFDLNNPTSFENINNWLEETRSYGHDKMTFIVVGNKSDLVQEVDDDKVHDFCQQHGFQYIKTSALTGDNVNSVYESIAQDVYQKILSSTIDPYKENLGIKIGIDNRGNTNMFNLNSDIQTKGSVQQQNKKSCC